MAPPYRAGSDYLSVHKIYVRFLKILVLFSVILRATVSLCFKILHKTARLCTKSVLLCIKYVNYVCANSEVPNNIVTFAAKFFKGY